jgi:hypothetical protein
MTEEGDNMHNRHAPYWATAMVVLCLTGLSSIWLDMGTLWKGYALDMAGPAWNYILFRGLFTGKTDNMWTRFFTPVRTLVIFVVVCFAIETMQYFGVYAATFDPWDFPAYLSLLVPVFVVDMFLQKK